MLPRVRGTKVLKQIPRGLFLGLQRRYRNPLAGFCASCGTNQHEIPMLWFRGVEARTQLRAVASATAPLALYSISNGVAGPRGSFTYWKPWWRNGVEIDASC